MARVVRWIIFRDVEVIQDNGRLGDEKKTEQRPKSLINERKESQGKFING